MPEGPSLILFREELLLFKGKKVVLAAGNTKIDKERMVGKKILDMKTWGKHLLLCFDTFTIRIHFLMFGTYYINSEKDAVPRLHLEFAGGLFLNLYSCGVKMVEEPLEEIYDWSGDVLHESWNPRLARKKLK
ncbi:MAG TPA: DNA-formamidopyrimidine glycosylase family protein, partial [Flavisolibacter sp.]|nr:DNA-formamidopyrimidine glycosylase family protein [Flavisolibacter sp.]